MTNSSNLGVVLLEVINGHERVSVSGIVLLEEVAKGVGVEWVGTKGVGGAWEVKRISDRKSASNDGVLALLTEVLEEDVASYRVSDGVQG